MQKKVFKVMKDGLGFLLRPGILVISPGLVGAYFLKRAKSRVRMRLMMIQVTMGK